MPFFYASVDVCGLVANSDDIFAHLTTLSSHRIQRKKGTGTQCIQRGGLLCPWIECEEIY
jgi:hypothetical protein